MSDKYYVLPRGFFNHKTFRSLSPAAKLLYLHYWNELHYSGKPIKVDEDGRPLISDEWKRTKEFLNLPASSGNTARRELLAAGLIRLSSREGYLLLIRDKLKEQPQPISLVQPE